MNIEQIKKCCICTIKTKNWGIGTGFFCNIISNAQVKLKVLITNSHILEKKNILPGKAIELSLDNGNINKTILIDESRKTFTHTGYDITIIEIKESDGLNDNSFLEIYYEIQRDINNIIKDKKEIYLLYYPMGIKEIKKSEGFIKEFNDLTSSIEHSCYCDVGAGGGPLIYSYNNKVIGIHKGGESGKNWKIGTLIEKPINEFMEKYKAYFQFNNNKVMYNSDNYIYNTYNNNHPVINPYDNLYKSNNNLYSNHYNNPYNHPIINPYYNQYNNTYNHYNNNSNNNSNNNFNNNPNLIYEEKDLERCKEYLQFIDLFFPNISINDLNEMNSMNNNGNKNEDKDNTLIIQFKYKDSIISINADKNLTIESLLQIWAITMSIDNNDFDSCIFIYKNFVLSHKSQEMVINNFKNNDLIEVINYKYLI